MLKKLFPRDVRFFDYFKKAADEIVRGAEAFRALLEDPSDVAKVAAIKTHEHNADLVTHETIASLHKVFITPLDREDIHQLIIRMDDILDFIDAAAQRIQMFEIRKPTPEMKKIADVILTSSRLVQKSVGELENIKKPQELLSICVEINRLENEADVALRSGVARLFKEESDVKELIKIKEILELLETATDRCEDVANIIEGIVLEYS